MRAYHKILMLIINIFIVFIATSCTRRNVIEKYKLLNSNYLFYEEISECNDSNFNILFNNRNKSDFPVIYHSIFDYSSVFSLNGKIYYNGKCNLYILDKELTIYDERVRAFDIYKNDLFYAIYDSTGKKSQCIIKKNKDIIFKENTESYDLSNGGATSIVVNNDFAYLNCHLKEEMPKFTMVPIGLYHHYHYSCIDYYKNTYINKNNTAARFIKYDDNYFYYCNDNSGQDTDGYIFSIYNMDDDCVFKLPLSDNYWYIYDYIFEDKLNLLRYKYNNNHIADLSCDYSIIQVDLNNYSYEIIELGNIYEQNKEIKETPEGYCFYNNKLYTLYVRSVYEYDFESKENRLLFTTNLIDYVTGINILDSRGIYVFAETYNDDKSILYYYDGELHTILIEEYNKSK